MSEATTGDTVEFEIDKILTPTLQEALVSAASGADCPEYIPEETVEEFLGRDLQRSDRLWPYQRRIQYMLPKAAEVLEALRRLGFAVLDNILHWRARDLLWLLAQVWVEHKHQLC